MSNYIPPEYFVLSAIAVLLFCFGIAIFLISVATNLWKRRSKEYRELLSDMYIVGMVKKFAEEDGIDLKKELREFAKIEKKTKISLKGLDTVIENELKEKIANVQTEKEKEK